MQIIIKPIYLPYFYLKSRYILGRKYRDIFLSYSINFIQLYIDNLGEH